MYKQERNQVSEFNLTRWCPLSNSRFAGAEAAAIKPADHLPLVNSHSEACCVDGTHILTLIVVRGAH
jgi:hypothetical protein